MAAPGQTPKVPPGASMVAAGSQVQRRELENQGPDLADRVQDEAAVRAQLLAHGVQDLRAGALQQPHHEAAVGTQRLARLARDKRQQLPQRSTAARREELLDESYIRTQRCADVLQEGRADFLDL